MSRTALLCVKRCGIPIEIVITKSDYLEYEAKMKRKRKELHAAVDTIVIANLKHFVRPSTTGSSVQVPTDGCILCPAPAGPADVELQHHGLVQHQALQLLHGRVERGAHDDGLGGAMWEKASDPQ